MSSRLAVGRPSRACWLPTRRPAFWRALLSLCTCVACLAGAPASASPASPTPAGPAFDVPGGSAAFARVLGTAPELPRSRLLTTAVRALWEAPEGADRLLDRRRAEVFEYLHRTAAAPSAVASGATAEAVPAYLPLDTWSAMAREPGSEPAPLFTAVLRSRRTSLVYYGVAALDPPTRAFLLAHPDLLRHLGDEEHAGIFATLGRSLRVRDGRVDVPGGPEAVALWEELTGERATDPARFMLRVLDQDAGRLALFYDGVAHLDGAVQRFALGLQLPAANRARRLRDLYRASAEALAGWQPSTLPFRRTPLDLVHLLLSVSVPFEAERGAASWRPLWDAVFEPPEVQVRLLRVNPEAGERLDAARLAEVVLVQDPVERRRRFQAWLFAGRVFRDVPVSSAKDLLVALGGFSRFPALMFALERMGVRSPAVYAAAVRAAGRLSAEDATLRQFQAALALVERAAWMRAIEPAAAERLIVSLSSLAPDDGAYHGAIAGWLERDFLAVAGDARLPAGMLPDDRPLETRVLAAMAGSVGSAANRALLTVPRIEWEGLAYRVDPTGAALRRLKDVRARQGGPALDAVLALARAVERLRTAPSSAAAVSEARQGLLDAGQALAEGAGTLAVPAADGAGNSADRVISETVERLKGMKTLPDAKARNGLVHPLLEALDEQLADVLVSLAYAPHLGDGSNPALLGGDPSRNHEFRLFKAGGDLGRSSAWDVAVEVQDRERGWHVSGSLLGLDVALGQLSLVRVARETMPPAPRMSEGDRQAFTESAVLMTPFDLDDARCAALLTAVERGRQRVTALDAAAPVPAQLAADAGLDEWRAQALSWTLTAEPERRLALFSLAELAALGGLDPAAAGGMDAWGTTGFSREQGLRSLYPARLPWSTLAGRRGTRGVAALVPDLAIAVADALARLRLPAQLTAGVMLVATRDYLDTLQTAHEDDWLAMVAHARAVTAGRIEDYVAAMTISGPLVPDVEDEK